MPAGRSSRTGSHCRRYVEQEIGPVLAGIVHALDPQRSRLLVATVEGTTAGWLLLRRDPHPLVAHCGVVNHVQTHTGFRGQGIGAALMRRVPGVARDEMGLERLGLAARSGLGLEDFYRKLGWVEVGRWPGALRVAPGDDRDEVLHRVPVGDAQQYGQRLGEAECLDDHYVTDPSTLQA
jgi:GNAT superfamily N-acetyltransferase